MLEKRPVADTLHLVGRDAELATVQRRLDRTLQGHGCLILIGGEAGIGKTSLAQAVIRRAVDGGAAAATGRGYEGGGPAFGPWQDLLADLAANGVLDPSALPPAFGGGASVQTSHQVMQSVVCAVRSAAAGHEESAGECPALVVLLDDVHWADRDSLELLDLMTRRLEDDPILVVATYRSEEVHRRHPLYDALSRLRRNRPVAEVTLRRLDRATTAAIAEARNGECSPQLVDSLHARSEGNPFFLVELLRDLEERQVLAHAERIPDGAISGGHVPLVLQQVIVGRIARLGGEVEQLLQVACVAGEEWDLGVVEAVLGWQEERLLQALEAALEAQIVTPTADGAERYRFSHGLICEVLYREQVARRLKHLHEQVAAALEDRSTASPDRAGQAATLAYHFSAAEQWDQALRYSMVAGDAAREVHANRGALQFYEQALDILPRASATPEDTVALYDRLGQLRVVLNQMEAARSAFEGMVQSAREGGDKVAGGRALFWLSFVQTRLSHMADARAAGDAAIEVARQAGDTRILAGAHWNLGRLHEASGELGLASRHLDEAERLARLEGDGSLVGRCLMEQARLSTWNGDYAHAERRAAQGLELAHAGRESIFLAGVCWILGIARGEQGHYSQALEALHHGLACAAEADDLHYPVKILNTLGWLHGEIGDAETALRYDREALEASRRGPADPIREAECYCLLNLATDQLQRGDVEAAELYLRDFEATDTGVEYARFRYLNRYHLARAQLALAKDDPEEALRWAKGAEDAAAAKAVRKNLAKSWMLTGQALAALQRPREAAEYLRRSVAVADELGHGSLRWQARLGLARVSVLIHRMTEAAVAVDVARELVDAIASDLRDDRLRDAFRCSRLVQEVGGVATELQRPAETPAYPAGLTAREVEVLRLVAQGATNKDIARALHISVKTVNAHLNNIFIKVDCSTRAAAAAFAVRHGLV